VTTRRKIADGAAGVAVVAVLALGALIVVKPGVDHWSDLYRQDPFAARTTTDTVVKQITGKPTETTTTTKDRDGSFAERALGNSGYLLFRVGIVLVAAFLAGAAVQRAALGEFSLEIGPVKVPELGKAAEASKKTAEASRSGISAVRARLTRFQRDAVARDAETREALTRTLEETERLRQQVEELERRLAGGAGPGRA
jgi:hypothetical protein